MTRRRLSRTRRKYNASRRVLRGWQSMQWNVLMGIVFALDDTESELRNLQLRQITRHVER